jgi:hypothetical protein
MSSNDDRRSGYESNSSDSATSYRQKADSADANLREKQAQERDSRRGF